MHKTRKLLVLTTTMSLPLLPLEGRVFTSSDGKKIEAEYLTSSDTHVTLKLKRNGKNYTIPLERLSEEDQQHIAEQLIKKEQNKKKQADKLARLAAVKKIVQYTKDNLKKKVGDGECWTLADQAFLAAGAHRPEGQIRVWGRELDWGKEKAQPGDILELESAHFSNGVKSGPAHTAVIIKCKRKGVVTVYHQNWGEKKVVTAMVFDLKSLTSGKAKIFRYE